MAASIEIGSIECKNDSCFSSLDKHLMSLKFFNPDENSKKDCIKCLQFLFNVFPLHNFPKRLGNAYWKTIYLIIHELPSSPASLLGKVLTYLSNEELFAYFSDISHIFRSYISKEAFLSFTPTNLKNTEFLIDCERSSQKIENIPKQTSSKRDPNDYFSRQVSLAESFVSVNLLISSLKYVKEKIFSYKNKEKLIKLIKTLLQFDEIKNSCQKFLLSINEFKLHDIQEISLIESTDIKHLSLSLILEFTKSTLAEGIPAGPFLNFSLEILKHGIMPKDLKNIEKVIKNQEFHSFCWHYIRCYFQENFETYIQIISSCVERSENPIKKQKNLNFNKLELKVTNLEKMKTLELGDFIIEAVNSKNQVMLNFLRGLTGLEIFKDEEDSQPIKDFFSFSGFQPASTLEQIVDNFIKKKSFISLPKSLSSITPVTVYKTLSLMPLQILQNSSEVPQSYILSVLQNLYSGKLFSYFEDFRSESKFLLNSITRSLSRTFSIICNESEIKSRKNIEVYIGYEYTCPMCGNESKDFCTSCILRKIPVVFPVFAAETPDFQVIETLSFEVKGKIAKNSIFKFFQEILEKCAEKVKIMQENHDCLKNSRDFEYITSCLLLKYFPKTLGFPLDSCSASLIQPSTLLSPKNKSLLRENLLIGKSLALNLVETSKFRNLIFKRIKLIVKIIIWPTENPDLLNLTRRSLDLLRATHDMTVQDLLSFTKPRFLREWAEEVSKTIGFLGFLKDIQEFQLEPCLPKIEVELLLKYDSKKVFQILKRLFKEYQSSEINLFYTSVIVGIAWADREDKLKDLEELCGRILGKSKSEKVKVHDLYKTSISEHLNEAKIFLLCELGLGRALNEWVYVTKTLNGQVVLPTANVHQFFKAFSIISSVFNVSEYLSQSVKHSVGFDWSEFFQLASSVDVIVLPDKTHHVNFLLGLCKLCFHFNELGENLQYLSTKIIGICGHLLEIDMDFMLQVLEELVTYCDIKLHYLAVLSLAFIGINHLRGQSIIQKVLSSISDDQLQRMDDLFFMLFNYEYPCLELLRQSVKKKSSYSNNDCFFSLQRALSINFPLVQYAALTLVPLIVKNNLDVPHDKLILALNKANSMFCARHHTGELPYSLGTMIDTCIGLVGAHYCIEPIEINYNHHLTAWFTCENFYSNIERLYLSQKMMEGSSNDSVVEILKSLYFYPKREAQEFPWIDCKSLREWTQNLIHLYQIEDLYPSIPLAQVNLDSLFYILPEIFRKIPSKHDYFVSYLTDFFENSPATYRRLMIKVIDKCPSLKSKLPITQVLHQYIDLNEFPRALHLLELKIRERVTALNKRYSPDLITKEEMILCQKIFQGLHSLKYLNSIPDICKSCQDKKKLFKSKFKSGFYSHFLISEVDPSLMIAASWRIGRIQEVELANNIESCLAYLLKSQNKEKAAQEVRNFLIKNSDIRIADFCQAYEHILIQHLIENIVGIFQTKYSFSELQLRNKAVQDKFVYKEMTFRVSFVMFKQMQNIRSFVASLYDLFKLAFLYRDYTYCHNLLNDLCIYDNFNLKFPLISRYLTTKYLLLTNQIDRKSLKSLENLWNFIPSNSESPEKLGFFSNLKLKYKVSVLIIRVLIFLSPSQISIEEAQEKYLKSLNENYDEIRLSLEKGFALLADHFFGSVNSSTGDFQTTTAEKVCLLYIKSLSHGHSQYCNSSTRVLLLFMKLSEKLIRSKELMDSMISLAQNLPLFIWADRVNELISYSNTSSEDAKVVLSIIFIRLLKSHHSQMIWLVGPYIVSTDKKGENRSRFLKSVYEKYCKLSNSSLTLNQLHEFFNPLIQLSTEKNRFKVPICKPSLNIAFPNKENFSIIQYSKNEKLWGKDKPGFIVSPILIAEFDGKCERLNSKSCPAKVSVRCSDNSKRILMCKYESKSDIRKETRVCQLIDHMNKIFSKDPECKRLNIKLLSYSIIYIGKKCVVVEWVNETSTVKSILRSIQLKSSFNNAGHSDPKTWAGIQERIRPCLHQYFFQKYPEPNDWLIARNNFTRTLAAWSIFGYVIGLGDRHLENIMICNRSGQVMFIDFECIFNLGLNFEYPELVPFRLTPELQTALGLFFEDGEFIKTAVKVLACMKKNISSIMIQLECFVNDPLSIPINNPEFDSKNFDLLVTLKIIRARLEGLERYTGTKVFLSDKDQVRFLADKAKDTELLRKMFQGWAPWE